MATAGKAAYKALQAMKAALIPGITTLELDEIARETLKQNNAIPALLNYHPKFSHTPYEFATCISVNDEILHGLPSKRIIKEGDIVGLDIVAAIDGWMADTAITVPVGNITTKNQRLLSVTIEALRHGIAQAIEGNRIGDISHAIQKLIERNQLGIVKEFWGHGIGREVHEPGLEVRNYGQPKKGILLREGMTFCIEPMVTASTPEIKMRKDDQWTILTRNGATGAHFEHTVAITKDGPRILTL